MTNAIRGDYTVFTNHIMFDRKSDAETYATETGRSKDVVFPFGMGWGVLRIKDEKKESDT